ncbi:MAG TPA: hypothetical protein PK079_11055 [Leptospiraceae bacterium]|nr:hypothetical protein [Leptospiraceae bacterium]HMW07425.1 hypothetical protein [Leptospiraceae bacterium]HMX34681.1 hypothetical protein [Leptospiraceae bacterium]HMY33004.1 hypothetical protein [Leptospiraceae bacterium]HMZ63538.1 hypothetical protein [Leptospiraceae bacterium]
MRSYTKSIFIIFLVSFLSAIHAKPSEDKGIKKAIRKGDTEFFKNIKFEDLKEGNKPNSEGKTLITRMEIDGVNALVGAFKNPDVEVRKIIYKELLYPEIFKDLEGVTVAEFMEQDKQLKQYLDKLRVAIYSVDELENPEANESLNALIKQYGYSVKEAIKVKNPKALAIMSPDFFKKSNLEDPKTVIVRFKKNGVKTLVKALEYEKGNPETRKLIIESLFYKTLGGPEKVVTKKKTRESRGENLFLIADKEKNPEVRAQLIQLAEAYYFVEDEATESSVEKKTENAKTESSKTKEDDEEEEEIKEAKK